MQIPETIDTLLKKGLLLLDANGNGNLDWALRAELYAQIEQSVHARMIRTKLALLAVEKTFFRVEGYASTGYWEPLLSEAMQALVALGQENATQNEAIGLEDQMYTATGNWSMVFDNREGYPIVPGKYMPSADFAANALYKALGEAIGNRIAPFESLKGISALGALTVPKDINFTVLSEAKPKTLEDLNALGIHLEMNVRPGTLFSEEEITNTAAAGDTAGAAACAYAYDDTQQRIIPERMAEFWRWWLTEALPSVFRGLPNADS